MHPLLPILLKQLPTGIIPGINPRYLYWGLDCIRQLNNLSVKFPRKPVEQKNIQETMVQALELSFLQAVYSAKNLEDISDSFRKQPITAPLSHPKIKQSVDSAIQNFILQLRSIREQDVQKLKLNGKPGVEFNLKVVRDTVKSMYEKRTLAIALQTHLMSSDTAEDYSDLFNRGFGGTEHHSDSQHVGDFDWVDSSINNQEIDDGNDAQTLSHTSS
jgi:hypothetical protein